MLKTRVYGANRMNSEIFKAILAMDAYNRGYAPSIAGLTGNKIGRAIIVDQSYTPKERLDSFYAATYSLDGKIIVSFRGTDFPPADLMTGWSGGVGGQSFQAERAVDYLNRQIEKRITGGDNAFNASYELVGHSLGGGLAGLLASLYHKPATIFDNMPFEASALRTYNRSLPDNPTSYDPDIERAYYRNGLDPIAPSISQISGAFIAREVLSNIRDSQKTPLDSYTTSSSLSFMERHSMATLVIEMFAKDVLNTFDFLQWRNINNETPRIEHTLMSALYDDKISQELGISDHNASRAMIAYSAIDQGTLVFGNTGIRALIDDSIDLAEAFTSGGNLTITEYSGFAVGTVAQIAISRAYNKVQTNSPDKFSSEAVQLKDGFAQIQFSTQSWGLRGGTTIPDDLRNELLARIEQENGLDIPMSGSKVSSVSFSLEVEASRAAIRSAVDGALYVFNSFDDSFSGGANQEIIAGFGGSDRLAGNGGNDIIIGGEDETTSADRDIAVYSGRMSEYDIIRNADGSYQINHVRPSSPRFNDGNDTLKGVEFAAFADQTVVLEKDTQDVVFVVDTSGSMGSSIDSVKSRIVSIAEGLFGEGNGLKDTRVGIVGFKDIYSDNPAISSILPFTSQDDIGAREQALYNAVSTISVSGGGTEPPESLYSGLLFALQGGLGAWRPGVEKSILLLTDAMPNDSHLRSQVLELARTLGASGASIRQLESDNVGRAALKLSVPMAGVGEYAVNIYTIAVGSDSNVATELNSIANTTGGKFFTSSSGDDVVSAFLDIVDREAAPFITSSSASDATRMKVSEGLAVVSSVTALDTNATDDVRFSIVGGADKNLFSINAITGDIIAREVLDFEKPTDSDRNGTYKIVVQASDGTLTDTQALTFVVSNLAKELVGTLGDDTINGSGKPEYLSGLFGDDRIYAGNGNDRIAGGFGADYIAGSFGDDMIHGGTGADDLNGEAGSDIIVGGDGDDTMRGEMVFVSYPGETANDRLFGGNGNDGLYGGVGDDILAGGSGNDWIDGAAGVDTYIGGQGADHFVTRTVSATAENDHILDFDPNSGDFLAIDNFAAGQLVYSDSISGVSGAAIVYDKNTGTVSITGDVAAGPGSFTSIIVLDNRPLITLSDILFV